MITISLCMIVKNEEAVLARCLDSLKEIADEIIIVDTGSTDRTKEIAAAYTDCIYDYQWEDDFSKARNFSFSKATKDYIYSADADEVIDKENQKKFLQLKRVLLPEIEIVQMLYCNQKQYNTTYNFDKEYRPKLYKRFREFVWQNPIHERIRTEPLIYDSEIEICHMPTSSHGKRDFTIFQKMFKQGIMIGRHLHNMYARELFIAGEKDDFIQAKEFFLVSIQQEGRSIDEIKESACVLSHIFRLQQDTVSFFQYVMKDIVTEPSSEACYELGMFYFEQEQMEEASNWFYNAHYETKSILDIRYQEIFSKEKLRECYQWLEKKYRQQGNIEKASDYIRLSLDSQ